MQAVVEKGTGSSLNGFSYHVAGKTGSAEFDSEGTSHAWFIGYAPAKKPKIAVSIVVEGAGTGRPVCSACCKGNVPEVSWKLKHM